MFNLNIVKTQGSDFTSFYELKLSVLSSPQVFSVAQAFSLFHRPKRCYETNGVVPLKLFRPIIYKQHLSFMINKIDRNLGGTHNPLTVAPTPRPYSSLSQGRTILQPVLQGYKFLINKELLTFLSIVSKQKRYIAELEAHHHCIIYSNYNYNTVL